MTNGWPNISVYGWSKCTQQDVNYHKHGQLSTNLAFQKVFVLLYSHDMYTRKTNKFFSSQKTGLLFLSLATDVFAFSVNM